MITLCMGRIEWRFPGEAAPYYYGTFITRDIPPAAQIVPSETAPRGLLGMKVEKRFVVERIDEYADESALWEAMHPAGGHKDPGGSNATVSGKEWLGE